MNQTDISQSLNPPATRNPFQLPEHLLEEDEQGVTTEKTRTTNRARIKIKKNLVQKKFLILKNLGLKNVGSKKICVQKKCGVKKF